MNTLTNLVQSGGQQPSKAKETVLSKNSNGQKIHQKFALLMMNFLGMNANRRTKEVTDAAPTVNEVNNQKSKEVKGEKNTGKQTLPSLFVGSHFISMKSAQANEMDIGKVSAEPITKMASSGTDHSTVPDNIPAELAGSVTNAVDVDGKTSATKKESTGKGKAAGNATTDIQKDNNTIITESNKTVPVTKGENTAKAGAASVQAKTSPKETSGPMQPPLNNVSTAAASEDQGAGAKDEVNKIVDKGTNEKQKNNAPKQKGSLQKALETQKSSSKESATQKQVALKHLMNQGDEKTKVSKDTNVLSGNAQSTSSEKVSATKRQTVLNSTIAQSTVAVASDKTSFKPILQNSSTLELDPTKVIKMLNGDSGEVEMELQARSDNETSGSDEGKASLKFSGSTLTPLSNSSGRREFSTQLLRQLQQPGSQKADLPKSWNHHRFVMDDGKAINVSVRHAEGAMQLQLSAGNSELNKVIRQHIDEIRQHLQEQMNVEIDLQLQHFGDQEAGHESKSSQTRTTHSNNGLGKSAQAVNSNKQVPARTARYLGFNNNEWTA